MTTATDAQVQNYSDSVIRPLCEQIRALQIVCTNVKATIGDVYDNLTNSPTWTDGNSSNPPHLMQPSDVLAVNTVIDGILSIFGGDGNTTTMSNAVGQYPIVLKGCVRAVMGN